LPVITPTYLAAQPSTSALADVSEKSQPLNHTLGILVTIVVIILVIIIGIGSCIYYRRIKHAKERNEEAQKYNSNNNSNSEYEPKNNFLEHHIDPQVLPNRGFDSVLLELSSLAGGMKPPPTTALPPIPMDAQLSTNRKKPPELTELKATHSRNKMIPKQDLTQSEPQNDSLLPTKSQLSSYSPPKTSNIVSSSTDTSVSIFGWDDSTDKIYESDSSLSSKCLDIIDSPTLPQHPSVSSVATKNFSGLLVTPNRSITPWTANDQRESEHFDPAKYYTDK
ncbi:11469_t:CDS:1, partial [Racocetra fulgida]